MRALKEIPKRRIYHLLTKNGILTEYDGLIFQKGISGIIAVNKLTVGLSLGSDNLLDHNKKKWIYENKLWYGLMLGLNLN